MQESAQCACFPFLLAAGFEPTSLSLGGGRLNRYPILTLEHGLQHNGGDDGDDKHE